MTVFIEKGDAPLSERQAKERGVRIFDAEKQQWQREQGIVEDDPEYKAWAAQWVADNKINAANNYFNHQLAAYEKAVLRLSLVEKAKGRAAIPAVTEDRQVWDHEKNELVTEQVVISPETPAVAPLKAKKNKVPFYNIEKEAWDGTCEILDPATVAALEKDATERAEAQEVIDNTPQEVIDYVEANA